MAAKGWIVPTVLIFVQRLGFLSSDREAAQTGHEPKIDRIRPAINIHASRWIVGPIIHPRQRQNVRSDAVKIRPVRREWSCAGQIRGTRKSGPRSVLGRPSGWREHGNLQKHSDTNVCGHPETRRCILIQLHAHRAGTFRVDVERRMHATAERGLVAFKGTGPRTPS